MRVGKEGDGGKMVSKEESNQWSSGPRAGGSEKQQSGGEAKTTFCGFPLPQPSGVQEKGERKMGVQKGAQSRPQGQARGIILDEF